MKKLLLLSFWLFTLSLSYYLGSRNRVGTNGTREEINFSKFNSSRENQSQKPNSKEAPPSKKEVSPQKPQEKTADKYNKKDVDAYLKKYDTKLNIDKLKQECESVNESFHMSCYQLRAHYKYLGKNHINLKKDRESCLEGDTKSCSSLRWDGTDKDKKMVKKVVSDLCSQGNAHACVLEGRSISSDEYKKNFKKSDVAFERYKKACELDSSHCYSFANQLEDRGDPRAFEFYETSCSNGQWYSCQRSADYYFKKDDLVSGEKFLRIGCENGKNGGTCWDYVQYLFSHNRGDEATELFQTVCQDPILSTGNFMCKEYLERNQSK